MQLYYVPLTIAFMVMLSLLAGGLVGAIIHQKFSHRLDALLILSGSILFGLVTFEVVPESVKNYPAGGLLLGLILAIVAMILADKLFHRSFSNKNKNELFHRFLAFVFLVLAISIHNIPTGLALGSSLFNASFSSGPLLTAVFLHHIPEGLSLMISTLIAGYHTKVYFLATVFLAGLLGLSIFFGSFLAGESLRINALLMGSAIGTLSYVSAYEMLWKTRKTVSGYEFVAISLIGVSIIFFFRVL